MHFTTLFILENETLENISLHEIEEIFCERFCYCCGETEPTEQYWCDWFQIGGRWCDILKAKKGIHCERRWSNDNAPIEKNKFSVIEIKDLIEPIDKNQIYAVAFKGMIYQKNGENEEFTQLLNDINNKRMNGVIALIDCHN